MNHEDARRIGAVEKYLLNEMAPPQRDEFEEHYFDCPVCADELRTTAAFLDGMKQEFKRSHRSTGVRQTPRKPWYEFLRSPAFAGPALAMLLLVIVYQNAVVLPRLSAGAASSAGPELLTSVSLIGANSRGGPVPTATFAGAGAILLSVDIPMSDGFAAYECDLIAPSGTALWRLPVTAEQARDTLAIRVPSGSLTPGDYRLIVRGQGQAASADLASYRFTVTRSE